VEDFHDKVKMSVNRSRMFLQRIKFLSLMKTTIFTYVSTYLLYTCVHTYVLVYIHTHIRIYLRTYIRICILTYVCIYVTYVQVKLLQFSVKTLLINDVIDVIASHLGVYSQWPY